MVLGKLNIYMQKKKIKLDYFLIPYRKNELKMDQRLKCIPETIKLLEENINLLFDISLSNRFLDLSPQARETKAKINKWDYIKLKRFFTVKETINKIGNSN